MKEPFKQRVLTKFNLIKTKMTFVKATIIASLLAATHAV
jgi:hypothetical protein